jgi:hypothetical protein
MSKLKPQLIIADSGRRKRGGGGGFWSFLAFLIVFAVGIYVGTKLDEYGITGNGDNQQSTVSESSSSATTKNVKDTESKPDFSQETLSSKEPAVIISEKIQTGESIGDDVSDLGDSGNDEGYDTDSGLVSLDPEDISSPGGEGMDENDVENDDTVDSEETTSDGELTETLNSGASGYTLQIAAFATPQEAEKVMNEYRGKGYDAYTVSITNSRGEEWNLVKIGRFPTIERAWDESAVFERREGQKAYVETLDQDTKVNQSREDSEESDQ